MVSEALPWTSGRGHGKISTFTKDKVYDPGWWFDACGPSNLNGMYFTQGQHIGKLNGIKWHYFKGPSYSLRATAMMIRPLDFS
ncbi:hypothetical protein INR49_027423 [Caranx melampygus]|nr:hypothetical protein INR49_027423 [Caranx melampygus]